MKYYGFSLASPNWNTLWCLRQFIKNALIRSPRQKQSFWPGVLLSLFRLPSLPVRQQHFCDYIAFLHKRIVPVPGIQGIVPVITENKIAV